MIKRVSPENLTVKWASRTYGATECRVKQLIVMYRDAGELQKLNLNRRPKTHLSDEEKAIIDKVWKETRVGARLLFYELKRKG